jgi:hypothetical protein
MSWEGQVLVRGDLGLLEWVSVRCSGRDGYTYRYPTELKAHQMLRDCYPDQMFGEEMQTIEVDKPANMS